MLIVLSHAYKKNKVPMRNRTTIRIRWMFSSSKFFFCFVLLRLLFSVEYKLPDINLTCDTVSPSKLGCRYITDCFVAQQVFLTRHQYIYHSIITHPTRSVTVDKFRVRVDTSLRSYDWFFKLLMKMFSEIYLHNFQTYLYI